MVYPSLIAAVSDVWPELAALIALLMCAACGGAGGISASMKRMNAASSSIREASLWRFSKPMVDQGLLLKRRPQTEPALAPNWPRKGLRHGRENLLSCVVPSSRTRPIALGWLKVPPYMLSDQGS